MANYPNDNVVQARELLWRTEKVLTIEEGYGALLDDIREWLRENDFPRLHDCNKKIKQEIKKQQDGDPC